MSESDLPKLSLLRLSAHVADLLLVSEGSIESVREPRTRIAWHVLFFSTVILFLLGLVAEVTFRGWLEGSTLLTQAWRCFSIAAWSWLLATLGLLAYRHYRFLLLTGKDLRFQNIAFFFIAGVALFGHLYQALYMLSPDLFRYPAPVVVPTAMLMRLSFPTSYQLSFDFVLYSTCVAVSIEYPRIASASALISFINVTQVLASVLIVALLVATFVQKARPE